MPHKIIGSAGILLATLLVITQPALAADQGYVTDRLKRTRSP